MELFSKRNPERSLRRYAWRLDEDEELGSFLPATLRNRLRENLKYAVSSNKYFEPFLSVKTEDGEFKLHKPTIDSLTMRELGYEMSSFIELGDLSPKKTEAGQDAKFFDLIEILIIFSVPEKRDELVARLKEIFSEEDARFSIHGSMIIATENGGLRSIAPLIKEKMLREKIQEYYDQHVAGKRNFEFLAKVSAEILQLLFSSPNSKEDTKKFSEDLCKKVANEWTEKTRVADLSALLSETVKNAKNLSNKIADVRHTDRTTIPVDHPDIYKLVASKNINLTEFFILSLPEMYVAKQDPEELKQNYLDRYGIDKSVGWIIKTKERTGADDIDPDDIPF